MQTKKEIRKEILAWRDSISNANITTWSSNITVQVCASEAFLQKEYLLAFASYGSEVITDEIITCALQHGKKVYLPKIVADTMLFYQIFDMQKLAKGYKGIREPKENTDCFSQDLVQNSLLLMPGVAFDENGARIGYGKGFYDRFLLQFETMECTFTKIALGFDGQVLPSGMLPYEIHDIKPDYIVTQTKWIQIDK